jgi:hypothetical protein
MNRRVPYGRRMLALITIAMLILTISPALAQSANPGVLPPNAHPHGRSYGEWAAAWWQWALAIPVDQSPLAGDGAVDCSYAQSGNVWFIGGFIGTPLQLDPDSFLGQATRACSVPTGVMLFFPVLNYEGSTEEGDGDTFEELAANTTWAINHVTAMAATVDGRPIHNLAEYRVQSPLFRYGPLPEGNFFELPAGTESDAVAEGFHLMLAPLPPGEHRIHFSGTVLFTEEADGFDYEFSLDITYIITVVPRGRF